ncbi:dipeptide ABC transporter ATP-binding protein [Shimia sp. R9_2]|uniref:ABC transporter ATP-binding protein n=1 Tax=Shimia sp. R9_2 TaxID=2821112 RepID=UPI001ADA03F1|nr:dipeptide ABC transporter ATP-binding protein [Shimia sp. R9_2]MBO9396756.1 dipeptide ABC transporter ATP-binding protein [Shimia sp. R9_2]
MTDDVILEALDVVKHFGTERRWLSNKRPVQAVDGVSLQIKRGETFAIVGESGCGKSTLARVLMRLLQPTGGAVRFDGTDISRARGADLTALRGDMQFIFQDPFSSLNPRMSVGKLVGEPLEVHAPELGREARRAKVAHLLRQVGLRPEHADRYPHEFSGGQRQRIGIARALAAEPKLIIGDEPVSALDVSVQAQVINLLADLRDALGLTLVVIAHDLGVIRHMSDRVAVMYLGRIVEMGTAEEVFGQPRHPYTQALLAAIPMMDGSSRDTRPELLGELPSPSNPPSGCRFHTRCPYVEDRCRAESPALAGGGHQTACHFWEQIAGRHTPSAPPQRSATAEARFALYRAATTGGTVIHKTRNTTAED